MINYEGTIVNDFNHIDKVIKELKSNQEFELMYDIETYTTNRKVKTPSTLQTFVYSFCMGYEYNEQIYLYHFYNFREAINFLISKTTKKIKYIFTAHNSNKYDNHFFRYSLLNDFKLLNYNQYKKNLTNKKIPNHVKKSIKDDMILVESRVKSSTSLTFYARIGKMTIETSDTLPKTNMSLKVISKMLVRANLMPKKYTKSGYNYTKYDKDEYINPKEAHIISKEIFINLDYDERIYIYNDVIILIYLKKYFSVLFLDFDYNKTTFMQNVKTAYTTNKLINFQIEKKDEFNNVIYEYNDYKFKDSTLYYYLQKFYRGGLNFYNTKYLTHIVSNAFSIDINSSYPYVLYTSKFPYTIKSFSEKKTFIDIDDNLHRNNDLITYMEVDKYTLNNILDKFKSRVLKQMIVKYYHIDVKTSNIYISSIILNLLKYTFKINIDLSYINVLSYITYTTKEFGNKEAISNFYYIKTQGKQDYILDYKSPLNIELTNKINNNHFTNEEISTSKVKLNGIYGLPALRKYFDYFYIDDNKIQSLNSGFENSERNILFSATVTIYAFCNLITPLSYFINFIDDYFIYCDTDSLYLKKEAIIFLPERMFHPMNLGSWDIENESIEHIYVLNHKKYVYYSNNKIIIKCAGVPIDNFNTNMSFERFIKTQFSDGVGISNKRSILNKDLTISIYNTETLFKSGEYYDLYYVDKNFSEIEEFISKIDIDSDSQLLYIETPIGSFTKRDFEEERYSHLKSIENLMKLEKYYL